MRGTFALNKTRGQLFHTDVPATSIFPWVAEIQRGFHRKCERACCCLERLKSPVREMLGKRLLKEDLIADVDGRLN